MNVNNTSFHSEKIEEETEIFLKIKQDNSLGVDYYSGEYEDLDIDIEDFLGCTSSEKIRIQALKNQGYTLVGVKEKGQAYPEYMRLFFDENRDLILNGEEKILQREISKTDISRGFQEFIFIKLIPKYVVEVKQDYQKMIKNILNNLLQK